MLTTMLTLSVGKTIELDARIPFLPKFRARAELLVNDIDIKKTEIKVLEACGWNPLYTTVFELLEFYQSQGIVFSSD